MSDVSLSLSKEVVQPIIEAKIQAAIVAAIGDPQRLIELMVERTMKEKVSRDGTKGQYSSDNKYTLVEAVSMAAVRAAVRKALVEWVAEHQTHLEAEVKKYLAKSPGKLARMLTDGFAGVFANKYRFTMDVKHWE